MHNFENFKGFAKAELELSKPFTILIGPNGAGKSNVIEAIELLSFIAYGGPLHEITDLGRGNYGLQIRGSLSGLIFKITSSSRPKLKLWTPSRVKSGPGCRIDMS
jgi:predicted ATPase